MVGHVSVHDSVVSEPVTFRLVSVLTCQQVFDPVLWRSTPHVSVSHSSKLPHGPHSVPMKQRTFNVLRICQRKEDRN